ncbi:SAF domain-containing protein [Frankia sp. AgB32]|uniref:SAF domain-containing protein n=1 Tax=Frankia sp. AgB32 TaxID=631119 RepID=UPI00200F11DE|nr:SAF domain-containing protein [Frankia sp. AgB32]MCK9895040.1 SAF domain-containing protein [Frankia sp. AgB32]
MTSPEQPADDDWMADEPDARRAAPPRRWAGAALALLLMAIGAAGALWLSSDGARRVNVVALARPLARGTVVEPADLAVVGVDAQGGPVRLVSPATGRRTLVGRPVLLDLPAGTLVSPDMVGSVATPAGAVSIGVTVSPDGLPSPSIRPGDLVSVVGLDPSTSRAVILTRQVQVAGVGPQATSGRPGDTVVFLTLPEQSAEAVETAAMSEHGVRLLGVGTGSQASTQHAGGDVSGSRTGATRADQGDDLGGSGQGSAGEGGAG